MSLPIERPVSHHTLRLWFARGVVLFLLIVAAIWGVSIRAELWTQTAPARFTFDIANALRQGDNVLADTKLDTPAWSEVLHAYVGRYEVIATEMKTDGRADLDYPPLRLLIATLWAYHSRDAEGPGGYSDDRAYFMLRINFVCEALALIGVLVLVRVWLRKTGASAMRAECTAAVCGVLFFLNPALLQNAHSWPQWDVWLAPFFIWAAVCMVLNVPILAGALLIVGSMMKGQLLLVLPMFALWALFRGRWFGDWKSLISLIAGIAFGGAILLSPWLVPSLAAGACVLVCSAIACVFVWLTHRRLVRLSWRTFVAIVALAFASFVLLASHQFGGSWAWLTVGFPTSRYKTMSMGPLHNLPSLLAQNWGWRLNMPFAAVGLEMPMRQWLIHSYTVCLVIVGIGVARCDARRNASLFVGLVAPWVLLFALLPQMHERYLVWAAMFSILLVAAHPTLIIVHVLLTLQSISMTSNTQLGSSGQQNIVGPQWWGVIERIGPGAGWLTLSIALLLLVLSLGVNISSPTKKDEVKPIV